MVATSPAAVATAKAWNRADSPAGSSGALGWIGGNWAWLDTSWRRRRDSNRWYLAVRRFSKPLPSTTRPLLQEREMLAHFGTAHLPQHFLGTILGTIVSQHSGAWLPSD